MKKTFRDILGKYHWETVRFCNLKITDEELELIMEIIQDRYKEKSD